MVESFILVFVLIVGLTSPLVLYTLVRREHDKREQMDRDTAEQTARRDTRNRKSARYHPEQCCVGKFSKQTVQSTVGELNS